MIKKFYDVYKKLVENTNYLAIVISSKSRILSRLYYSLNSAFDNEKSSVIAGRKEYKKSLKLVKESSYLLRRNIHRIEKGLIMKPRRERFAEGFILETVESYLSVVKSKEFNIGEKKWAKDVLDAYFKVVNIGGVIERAKLKFYTVGEADIEFQAVKSEFIPFIEVYEPYPHNAIRKSEIKFDDFSKLLMQRRSVRWYSDKAVPFDLIKKAVDVACYAPSACNRQPYKFYYCSDKKKVVSIAKCAGGTSGFADNITSIMLIVGDLSAYPNDKDRHTIYIDGALAAMQLMLSLETLGLSTCSINWPEVDANEVKIRKIVDLENYEKIIMMMAIGYADSDGGVPYSHKKNGNLVLKDLSQ